MKINNTPLSLLDLSLVREGFDFAQAFKDSVRYAQFAEKLGFNRIWLAEHHNAKGIASSATSVVIGHIAENTKTIRVGAGGIMLPNHSPLQVAEAFGTLETLYPNRIDLGLGRAPGTDQTTMQALRRSMNNSVENYPNDIHELIEYFGRPKPNKKVNAYPGVNTHVPVWILGSSPYSAQVAAHFGLPYAFASHFAPTHLQQAMDIYRSTFKASAYLDKPYFMPAANVIIAETNAEAEYLSTSYLQMANNIVQGKSSKLMPPVDSMDSIWSPQIKMAVDQMRKFSFVGTADYVKDELEKFSKLTHADEIMLTSYYFDPKLREKGFRMLQQA